MQKDFDTWNEYKKTIDSNGPLTHFNEREIWWCSIGVNIGSEQDSYSKDFGRPVIVFKKFTEKIFLGVPLTTKVRRGAFRIPFQVNGIPNDMLMLQIRAFDQKRLMNKIADVSHVDFNLLVSRIIDMCLESTKTPSEGVSKAEARVCTKMKTPSYVYSLEDRRILSNFFGDRYFPRLAISSRM
ncbi:MAG TPA: type II toxin-antitoxin system PemK/MazF family toxin [Candidatus Paceibacterota bacterium]|jgi:mRNA interferase MazF|nr:type II toxin-antitoxin system PemK/MazF family toxin [Candidatus Paceibacterota bacterium]